MAVVAMPFLCVMELDGFEDVGLRQPTGIEVIDSLISSINSENMECFLSLATKA